MTSAAFTALATLAKLRQGSRTHAALRAIYVDNVEPAQAAKTYGLTRQTLHEAIRRTARIRSLARIVK